MYCEQSTYTVSGTQEFYWFKGVIWPVTHSLCIRLALYSLPHLMKASLFAQYLGFFFCLLAFSWNTLKVSTGSQVKILLKGAWHVLYLWKKKSVKVGLSHLFAYRFAMNNHSEHFDKHYGCKTISLPRFLAPGGFMLLYAVISSVNCICYSPHYSDNWDTCASYILKSRHARFIFI